MKEVFSSSIEDNKPIKSVIYFVVLKSVAEMKLIRFYIGNQIIYIHIFIIQPSKL
tara:strand:+ start:1567 stop:1731 length:165 start_codon:yes stop_codon:yes gene_type:complete